MTPTKELKKRAREALAEKMGTVILAFVVLIILSFGSGWISNTLFPENSKQYSGQRDFGRNALYVPEYCQKQRVFTE